MAVPISISNASGPRGAVQDLDRRRAQHLVIVEECDPIVAALIECEAAGFFNRGRPWYRDHPIGIALCDGRGIVARRFVHHDKFIDETQGPQAGREQTRPIVGNDEPADGRACQSAPVRRRRRAWGSGGMMTLGRPPVTSSNCELAGTSAGETTRGSPATGIGEGSAGVTTRTRRASAESSTAYGGSCPPSNDSAASRGSGRRPHRLHLLQVPRALQQP